MKIAYIALLSVLAVPAVAAEPDNLVLPKGFHASVVADNLGPARHIAVRSNGDIFVSTRVSKGVAPVGIVALRLDRDHKVVTTERFSNIDGGTGIRIYKDALYAASPNVIYRMAFQGAALLPGQPETMIQGIPEHIYPSRGLVFDGKGNLFVTVGSSGNICADPSVPSDKPVVGLKPCPMLDGKSGVWRFDATKMDQNFATDGEQIATGLRDMMAVDWSPNLNGMYGVMQGRNDKNYTVSEEMHRVEKGVNLGWPYTYFDLALNKRLVATEYGGDGQIEPEAIYDAPVLAMPAHQSPLDLLFYNGKQFPKSYRGGAFVVFRGGQVGAPEQGHNGYDVVFVPFDRAGKAGEPQIFAQGFAGPNPTDRNAASAMYRPTGAAVAPDGSLYVVDEKKGRLWRIYYDGKS